MHFALSGRKPEPASRRPPRLWGLLEILKICCIATPPPPSPLLLLPSSPPLLREAPKSRRHQALPPWKWTLAPLPELAIIGEQAMQESAALQMVEAPAKDDIGSGK